MDILRVDMGQQSVSREQLPDGWEMLGGRALVARVLGAEVPPQCDPLGADNKLVIAAGPLAGTMAPQFGRISMGAKSPLTWGIKESNSGGPAAQKLDKLGVRAIVVEGEPPQGKYYVLRISGGEATLHPADGYVGMNNHEQATALHAQYGKRTSLITIGTAGERKYKSAAICLTDAEGNPSRFAGRGGMGAVMGSKGVKAIIVDDSGTSPVPVADKDRFQETVKSWVSTIKRDVVCGLFSQYGTSLAVNQNSWLGTMVADNYHSGRPARFRNVNGETTKETNAGRGGKMHGCMPGCVVQCSIMFHGPQGKPLVGAFEYEAVAMLGTNLGISDIDGIARLQSTCNDIGVDFIEMGSSLGVAAEAGRMRMGDVDSAVALLDQVARDEEFGQALANGVVATAQALDVHRVPAFKRQSIPAHDPRAVKGVGVTYATSPMGADHTAGLTYRRRLNKSGQIDNSVRSQIEAAASDSMGYCLNATPGAPASVYDISARLLNARYRSSLSDEDVFEIGRQTLLDEIAFNDKAGFNEMHEHYPSFVRTEALYPTNAVFDVPDEELNSYVETLKGYRMPRRIWEVRFNPLPDMLVGTGVVNNVGARAKRLGVSKAFLLTDPVMVELGRAREVQDILDRSGVASTVFSDVEPDPPVEEIDKAGERYRQHGCDGIIGLGGGSVMDAAKVTAVRVTHPGPLAEYDATVGGAGKISGRVPPVICIPTTSGTGSEVNRTAMITDKERNTKFPLMAAALQPRLAVMDPALCSSMPKKVTASTGLDALSHCIEGYVARGTEYQPYYDAMALEGVKLIGRSLKKAYDNGDDLSARLDMCMAAAFGAIAVTKGLGVGHAIAHVLGGKYHVPHGDACAMTLLCFVRANQKVCKDEFTDLAWLLDRSYDLELALVRLYGELGAPTRLKELGIPEEDLPMIAFEATKDVANRVSNPVPQLTHKQILDLLKEFYS